MKVTNYNKILTATKIQGKKGNENSFSKILEKKQNNNNLLNNVNRLKDDKLYNSLMTNYIKSVIQLKY